MQIGEVIQLKNIHYVIVNKEGTLEKLPKLKWYTLLYLEILQGLGKYLSIEQVRKLCYKKGVIK